MRPLIAIPVCLTIAPVDFAQPCPEKNVLYAGHFRLVANRIFRRGISRSC